METNVTRGRQIVAWVSAVTVGGPAAFGGVWLHHTIQGAVVDLLPGASRGDPGGLGVGAGIAIGLMVASGVLRGRPPVRGIIVGTTALTALICVGSVLDAALSSIRSDPVALIAAAATGVPLFAFVAGAGMWWFKLYWSEPELKAPGVGGRLKDRGSY